MKECILIMIVTLSLSGCAKHDPYFNIWAEYKAISPNELFGYMKYGWEKGEQKYLKGKYSAAIQDFSDAIKWVELYDEAAARKADTYSPTSENQADRAFYLFQAAAHRADSYLRIGNTDSAVSDAKWVIDSSGYCQSVLSGEVCGNMRAIAEETLRKAGGGKMISRVEAQPISRVTEQNENEVVLRPQNFIETGTGMQFIYVNGGCYEMGDFAGGGDKDEMPVHKVCLDSFYVGKYEVTVGEFQKFIEDVGYATNAENGEGCHVTKQTLILRMPLIKPDKTMNWRNPGFSQDARNPVVCVSWNDTQAFIDWLSRKTGANYRLLTEAEWEYAARSGGQQVKWSGTNDEGSIGDFAWFEHNSEEKTHVVGQKMSNKLGLHDMSGNAWEWVADYYDETFYTISQRDNPKRPGLGSYRSYRGGCWANKASNFLRTTKRNYADPRAATNFLGFRIARALD